MGKVIKVSGPLVVADGLESANMADVVRVGEKRLIGEILNMTGGRASIQVYEETGGLGPGAEVVSTGAPLSVELGPGLIGNIYDGIQRPLEEIMRPEFLNRIDEIIAFNQLTEDNFRLIAEIMLNELKGTLADKEIRLTWDDSLLALLVEKSYSVKYGARNLRRLIEKEIENPLANAIVTGDKPLLGAHLSAEDGRVKLDTI